MSETTTTPDPTVLVVPVTARPRWAALLLSRDAAVFYTLFAVIVYAYTQVPYFASTQTIGFMLLDVIPALMIAMPMALVIITGEIDLSVASVAGLTSAVMGVLWQAGWPIIPILIICIVLGAVAGAFNGFLVATVGLPSLAVTIGTLALYRGFALVVIGDNAVANFPRELTDFATSKLGNTGVPTVMLIALVVILFFGILLHFTPFGRSLYALGYNKEAATFVGIKVAQAKFWLFVAAGVVSGLVGIYWTLRYSSARSDNATGIELAVIAAVLLGGVSIFGGKGTIPGVVAGVLLIGTINYALRLGRVSDVVLSIVTGTLLVASVVAPSVTEWLKRQLHARRSREAIRELGSHESSAPAPGVDHNEREDNAVVTQYK